VDINSPDGWRWIWFGTAVVFGVAEAITPRAFFFLPFAIGAVAGALTALAGGAVAVEWLVFAAATAVALAALLPVGRRLARPSGRHAPIGGDRWVGRQAHVLDAVPAAAGLTGTVLLGRERWRAESGAGVAIPAGSTVLVTGVDGTRLVVLPLEVAPPATDTDQGAV
jgi:membrane protein implicated in regulation of membrane protease activity